MSDPTYEPENNLDSLEYDDELNSQNDPTTLASPTKPDLSAVTAQNVHNITDVYELAAAIGNSMESLISEFGQEKMQNLTKEIVRCLECFEKTVNVLTKETENSLEHQYNLEKSKHEVSQIKARHETEVKTLDNTIDQLQATIDTLQISNDALLDNFDLSELNNNNNTSNTQQS